MTEALQVWLQGWRQLQWLLQQERWQEALEQIHTLCSEQDIVTSTVSPWHDLSQALRQICLSKQDLHWQLDPWFQLKTWQAQCLHHLGQTPQAIAILKDLSEHYPLQAPLHHQLSRYLLAMGQEEEAIIQLHLALQSDLSYLPAYEDLAYLAHYHGASDVAYTLIQRGLAQGFSPRLLEEWLLLSADGDTYDVCQPFLELCIQHITPDTLPLLLELCKNLYRRADYAASEYLSFHLLQAFPEDAEVLDLHLLSALQLGHWAPVIRLLKQLLHKRPDQAGYWYRLAVAYGRWQMPLLSRYSLAQALSLNPPDSLKQACLELLEQLPTQRSLEQSLHELMKECLLDSDFQKCLQTEPVQTLTQRGIEAHPDLIQSMQKILNSFTKEN